MRAEEIAAIKRLDNLEKIVADNLVDDLLGAVKRENAEGVLFLLGVLERYSENIVSYVKITAMQQSVWLDGFILGLIPEEDREELNSSGYDDMADLLITHGLRPEDHIRRTGNGVAFTTELIALFAQTEFPAMEVFGEGTQSIQGVGIPRSPFYWHSKAVGNGISTNSWGFISILISAALGWNPQGLVSSSSLQRICEAVPQVSPTVDVDKMLFRARYDDRVLDRLATLLEEAIRLEILKTIGIMGDFND